MLINCIRSGIASGLKRAAYLGQRTQTQRPYGDTGATRRIARHGAQGRAASNRWSGLGVAIRGLGELEQIGPVGAEGIEAVPVLAVDLGPRHLVPRDSPLDDAAQEGDPAVVLVLDLLGQLVFPAGQRRGLP